jgi:uncharacterized Fe-S cluster-containing MiaB family protein
MDVMLAEPNTPTVTCAKCNKLVDKMITHYNLNNDTRVYTVVCHGEHETTTLTALDMLEAHSISGGMAFVGNHAIAKATGGK